MIPTVAPGDPTLEALVQEVLSWTGYRADPIHTAAIRRVVRTHVHRGETIADLLDRAVAREPELARSLLKAVSVPETYFFRQPEHFEWIADEAIGRFAGRRAVRAWSAGCATGEEAYSLAACLLARVADGVAVDVLGTDILAQSLDAARLGSYGAWSQRLAGPILFPVCAPTRGRHARVLEPVRRVVRFEAHNLLAAPPGCFDVILCRNVLLYFTPEASEAVLRRLVSALAPGGVIAFATLDVSGVPEGLERVGPGALNVFAREQGHERAPPRSVHPTTIRPPRRASTIPPASSFDAAVVGAEIAMHVRVLSSIERGDRRGAERDLGRLRDQAPDYLPGLFEHALLLVRHGDRERAVAPMRELLRRLEPLAEGEMLAGPERLPVSYYKTAARAFLSIESQATVGRVVER